MTPQGAFPPLAPFTAHYAITAAPLRRDGPVAGLGQPRQLDVQVLDRALGHSNGTYTSQRAEAGDPPALRLTLVSLRKSSSF